jgi:hypothetical protein
MATGCASNSTAAGTSTFLPGTRRSTSTTLTRRPLTAPRAQLSTAAFALGSDELYREWGYTALSRHRHAARFYVSAGCEFLNKAPEPLRDRDVPVRVAQVLRDSRAECLALDRASRESDMGLSL